MLALSGMQWQHGDLGRTGGCFKTLSFAVQTHCPVAAAFVLEQQALQPGLSPTPTFTFPMGREEDGGAGVCGKRRGVKVKAAVTSPHLLDDGRGIGTSEAAEVQH